MKELLTPARLILTTLYLGLDEGLEAETVMERAGLPPSRLEDMDSHFTMDEVRDLLQASLELTDDPALGLHLGQEFAIEMLDLVGMVASRAPDMRTAIQHAILYAPLITTLGNFRLTEEGSQARVTLHLMPELLELNTHFIAEIVAAGALCIGRRVVAGDISPSRMRFRLPAPPWQAEYAQVFGEEVEILFEAGEDSLEFDRRLLDYPMKRHSPGLYQHLRQQAARRLASLPQPESTRASVERLIGEYLGERLLDLPTIAERMGLTPRTLQRRLKEEGSSFQTVYDHCRQQQAHLHLTTLDTDIHTLAALLGYSEPANFYRAFKGWFGLTPSEYRRRHRPGND